MNSAGVSKVFNTAGFRGFILFCISLIGFLLMYVYALYQNQSITDTMEMPLDPSSMANVYATILGNRVNGQRIALAREFPSISGLLGYQNRYTPDMINSLIIQYGFVKEDIVLAMFYLETGLTVNPNDPWFSGGNPCKAPPCPIPNHAPTIFNSLLYWVRGDSPIIITPNPAPPQNTFNFAKDALPYINSGVGFLGVLVMIIQFVAPKLAAAAVV